MAVRLCCPTCKRDIEWSEAYPFRPFCSERCRLIDLGAWLSEQRAIPGKGADDGTRAGYGESANAPADPARED